ncbi:probable ATP-dependent RNA helicase DDX52 [Agrilus planipennis]|uniref:Probable ATP-dependent RNA helicase DDX52 n=1 Tax=Agrilus planipennis TaxID=224129 RepID=A0A1W4XMH0_AGRPL|nr:probable ATP-dependent RNA helicase DDX52 [Agrilus planipennis]
MDTYDIFKKLSRGAKFKRKEKRNILLINSDADKLNKLPNTNIAENKLQEVKMEQVNENFEEHDQLAGYEITLLGNMKADETGKKSKKRKLANGKNDEQKRVLLEQEKVNHFRNLHNINVVGKNIPNPIISFDDIPIKQDLKDNIKTCGYYTPTPIQMQTIPTMMENRQVLACAPTGSGKTAAFLLPIIYQLQGPQKKGFRTVIVCPTRELAKQTQRECERLAEGRGLRIHVINKISKAVEQFGPNSSKKFDILVTTPNRLCYLLKQEPPISLENVEWLIIDEADKLFESGIHSFRKQLEQILVACNNGRRKIAMFSATHTPVIAKWCVHNMKGLVRITVGQRNAATDTVEQELLFVGSESGKLLAFRDLIRKGLTPPVLVFVQSKDRAQQLFSELIYDGINVDAIHADRTQTQRDNTVRCFREGKIWVLICTELMARGIDFKGVNLVINYDFPPSAISYVHRIGRAGRAGRKGKAITFFTIDDTVNLRSIAHIMKQSGCEVPAYMLTMKKQSKKEKKKMLSSAPLREDITTIPEYELQRRAKRRRRMQNDLQLKQRKIIERDEQILRRKKKIRDMMKFSKKTKKVSKRKDEFKKDNKSCKVK